MPTIGGFQGSVTTGAEVTFYRRGNDPIILVGGAVALTGRNERSQAASLISVNIQRQLGSGAAWSITMKAESGKLSTLIVDDDWVDIVLIENGKRWHVMRGVVEDIRRNRTVSGTGATMEVWTISGRDFQKIWEQTPVWWNKFSAGNAVGNAMLGLLEAENLGGNVANMMTVILQKLPSILDGRSNAILPADMPQDGGSGFLEAVSLDLTGYTDVPARAAVSESLMAPQGDCWSLAKEWSDPMFCELFCELVPATYPDIDIDTPMDLGDLAMVAILRDRPFPIVESTHPANGSNSAWFALPLFNIPAEWIVSYDIGRSGVERYNTFLAMPQVTQELLGDFPGLQAPIWNQADIQEHGLRLFDVMTRYSAAKADLGAMTELQRAMVRDWYAINPYLFNGTIGLGRGMPMLKLGSRVRVPGVYSEDQDETYYLEGYSHSWQLPQGTRTNLTVTRGWLGTESSLLDAIQTVTSGYVVADRKA